MNFFEASTTKPISLELFWASGLIPRPSSRAWWRELTGLTKGNETSRIPPYAGMKHSMCPMRNKLGYTIFELMVTLILAGIMLSGAFFIYQVFMNSLDQAYSNLEMERQGSYALALMEARVRQGSHYEIGNHGTGTDNRITVTLPVISSVTGAVRARDVDYFQDGTVVKEKLDRETTVVPDTHFQGLQVEELKFTTLATDENGNGISVTISLTLKFTPKEGNEERCRLMGGARLRNAGT